MLRKGSKSYTSLVASVMLNLLLHLVLYDNICCFSCVYTIDVHTLEERVGIPLTGLTLPHFCVCPQLWPGFTRSYVMVFLVLNGLRLLCWYWWYCWSSLFKMSFLWLGDTIVFELYWFVSKTSLYIKKYLLNCFLCGRLCKWFTMWSP